MSWRRCVFYLGHQLNQSALLPIRGRCYDLALSFESQSWSSSAFATTDSFPLAPEFFKSLLRLMEENKSHSAVQDPAELAPWRERIHEVIFEADTPGGKAFDVALFVAIVVSVLAVILESVSDIREKWGLALTVTEWFFTLLFTVEYILRLISVRQPIKYATSFFGLVDLLATIPTYLSLFIAGSQSLLVIRTLRLLRIFRVFKLARHLSEAEALMNTIRATRTKITVFLFTIASLTLIMGSMMYLIEGGENEKFDSIPRGIYWAIVTMTTVGYGDIHPQTPWGQALAAVAMIVGYSIIIVPTGIFSAEIARQRSFDARACRSCGRQGHDLDAVCCKYCGSSL